MDKINSFKDLLVWQRAYRLAKSIYEITRSFPDNERFGLTSQIRRASVSVGSNIVEGFARKGVNDSLNFYNIANASLEEMKFQLMLCFDFKYVSEEKFSELSGLADEVGRMLRGWSDSRRKQA